MKYRIGDVVKFTAIDDNNIKVGIIRLIYSNEGMYHIEDSADAAEGGLVLGVWIIPFKQIIGLADYSEYKNIKHGI